MRKILLVITLAMLGGAMTSHATPVVYDFTGTGSVSTFTRCLDYLSCPDWHDEYGVSFTGSVTIDVRGGPNAWPDGSSAYYAGGWLDDPVIYDGSDWQDDIWVESHFVVSWDANTFQTGPVPYQTTYWPTDQTAFVHNDTPSGHDALENEVKYYGETTPYGNLGAYYESYARMHRFSRDLTWLDDLSFPTSVGLAPGEDASNFIQFREVAYDWSESAGAHEMTGISGIFFLQSLTPRTARVPEPATIVLLGIGLVPLVVVGRRHGGGRAPS